MAFLSSCGVSELPLFPLPEIVLFPNRPLPLHIFEYRYRIMINTILESNKRFGVLMSNPENGQAASIGCCAEIVNYQRLPDDRFKIDTLGQQRFRVLSYAREKPYLVGLVEWIEDTPPAEDLRPLGQEVEQLLRDVVRLHDKLTDQKRGLPDNLPSLPLELSYWVASNLQGAPLEQQHLLELLDTAERLRRESEILTSTRNYYAAGTALKEALN
jgi:ATP-dependent Lon protease